MVTSYVSIDWNGAPCACRCRHCYLDGGERKIVSVSYERARGIAERYISWAATSKEPIRGVSFGIGASNEVELPVLVDLVRFRKEHAVGGWWYLSQNGMRVRTREELLALFAALKDAGISLMNLSYYGLGAAHDDYAGRRGDLDYLLLMAEVMAELGLGRSDTIIIRKPTMADLPELLDRLDSIADRRQLVPNVLDYLGRAPAMEHERPELEDLDALPSAIRERISPERYRTEESWTQAILCGDIPENTKRVYVIDVNDENADCLEREDCGVVLGKLWEREQARLAALPTIEELARRYGESSSRLYAFRDIEWKLRASYYAEHEPAAVRDWLDPSRCRVRLG